MRLFLILLALAMAGCASTSPKPIPDDPDFAPVLPDFEEEPLVATGSLFQDSTSQNLYSDRRAARVGDIITVLLKENNRASKSAKTELDKETAVSLDPVMALGKDVTINGNPISVGINGANSFAGESDADQANQLNGAISVHVVKVLPNGTLMIRGEKWITINNGDEFIRLTGIVRQDDISADNMVDSTRVANARLQYSGTGDFAQTQQQGWLSRFFNSSWWPF
ncbi:flagellar basal body L-ring protein FlgH [Gallaecimonas sp. GXIMD4217]|uniref:flagellar basal body L-ring protein FlgH n=1 Tax=Gallaecimonas sp. GXIMD4217 TaxID=3131927 RepID=UPI00311AD71A